MSGYDGQVLHKLIVCIQCSITPYIDKVLKYLVLFIIFGHTT